MLSPCLFQQKTRRHAHTRAHATHMHAHTCMYMHTCNDPRRPLLSCYPRVCSSKTHVGTHMCTHSTHACTHRHTCSDPRRPLLSCYLHACSSKTHTGTHTHVHTQHTYACTHVHTHAHSQAKPLCCCFPLPPSSVSFTTGPRLGHHSSARGFSHHTFPFSTMSHTHRGKSSVSSLKSECLLPE